MCVPTQKLLLCPLINLPPTAQMNSHSPVGAAPWCCTGEAKHTLTQVGRITSGDYSHMNVNHVVCLSLCVCVCVCCWWFVRLSCQLAGSRWRLMGRTNNKRLAMIINMLMAISNTHSNMPTSVCVWRVRVILHRRPREEKLPHFTGKFSRFSKRQRTV